MLPIINEEKGSSEMKQTFKWLAAFLTIASVIAGCSGQEEPPANGGETSSASEAREEAPVSLSVPELSIADDAVSFAKSLKLGWNLGNTLDATGSSDLSSETSWGQPLVTKELIDYVAECGFTSIRIPVSWGKHTSGEDSDSPYTIDEEWMDRVNMIVDYAVDSGLYIILNSHHDCDFYYPKEQENAGLEQQELYIRSIWSQIAERFSDYDERLVFESMNEPRLMNTNKEWWFADSDPEGVASIECIMKLNQVFVDTVRAAGGKNETRYLMVPSNAASPSNALNKVFEMPEDSSNRLIVSVHAYTPYDFAMNENGYDEWNEKRESELEDFMSKLNKKFTKNGYGVVIGEFGATNKGNLEARVSWADSYTRLASGYGISCFLWDNGGTKVGSENFGMIDRNALQLFYPEILESMLKNYQN